MEKSYAATSFHDRTVEAHRNQYRAILDSPIGKLGIKTDADSVQGIDFLDDASRPRAAENALAEEVVRQLKAYFKDPGFTFNVPIDMLGTEYQRQVWQFLQTITTANCLTYSEVAEQLQSGPRAVGGACRANPIPIMVPCHRVISKSGVGGYDGDWGSGKVNIKKWLLRHEGII